MSEVERRRSYWYNAILIESDRVLVPQFGDAVIHISGAQVELLRNVTQYLRRRQTYVSEHNPGYYLVPDDADWDDILAIVSELEETLMGNPNTIFGYYDRLAETEAYQAVSDASYAMWMFTVPAGYIYTVQAIASRNNDEQQDHRHHLYDGSDWYLVAENRAVPALDWVVTPNLNYTLKEGDACIIVFVDSMTGDNMYGSVWGYKMKVPE